MDVDSVRGRLATTVMSHDYGLKIGRRIDHRGLRVRASEGALSEIAQGDLPRNATVAPIVQRPFVDPPARRPPEWYRIRAWHA
ncbi:hypothetical protein GCM10009776_37480 [Microbacterium deminutum]|uniref:Uncharacterized protein n=1 Tax=Microbacterium deminutum TaxID=344164 RepID=A0ABP5CY95_9MICO